MRRASRDIVVPRKKDVEEYFHERTGIWVSLANGRMVLYPQNVLMCPLCPVADGSTWWRSFCAVSTHPDGITWFNLPTIAVPGLSDRHARPEVRKEFRRHIQDKHGEKLKEAKDIVKARGSSKDDDDEKRQRDIYDVIAEAGLYEKKPRKPSW